MCLYARPLPNPSLSLPQVSSFTLNVAQRVSVIVNTSLVPADVHAVWVRITPMPMVVNGTSGGLGGDLFRRRALQQLTTVTEGQPQLPPFTADNATAILDMGPFDTYLAWIQLTPLAADGSGGTPPAYATPLPLPTALAPAGDTNIIEARPVVAMVAPAATYQMGMVREGGDNVEWAGWKGRRRMASSRAPCVWRSS